MNDGYVVLKVEEVEDMISALETSTTTMKELARQRDAMTHAAHALGKSSTFLGEELKKADKRAFRWEMATMLLLILILGYVFWLVINIP